MTDLEDHEIPQDRYIEYGPGVIDDPADAGLARRIAAVEARIAKAKPRIADVEARYLTAIKEAVQAGGFAELSTWEPAPLKLGREHAGAKASVVQVDACIPGLGARIEELERLIANIEWRVAEFEWRATELEWRIMDLRERYKQAAALHRTYVH